jgi:hypothetical protein
MKPIRTPIIKYSESGAARNNIAIHEGRAKDDRAQAQKSLPG